MKAAAVLTIRDGAKMTKRSRQEIAKWLERQRQFFLTSWEELSPGFRARYLADTLVYKQTPDNEKETP
jgi:hypothetical protein